MFLLSAIMAVAITAPRCGETVPLLRPAQKDYITAAQSVRFARLDTPAERVRLVKGGHTQLPVRLAWSGSSGESVLSIRAEGGRSQTFSVTNIESAYVTNLEVGRRYVWSVSSGGESAESSFETEAQPPRLMRIEGVTNVRDLGGWRGAGGRRVRQGMVYRSAGFRGSAFRKGSSIFANKFEDGGTLVTPAGIAELRGDLGVKTDIELRGPMETVFMSSSVLGPDVKWVKEPFAAYNFIDNIIRGREPFARLFRTFADAESYPVIFHCSGGRDRTGTLSLLLLGLLGVGDDDLCRDWEASIFTEASAEFGSARLGRLTGYLRSLGGSTLAECCEIYARSAGVSDGEIEAFRRTMLEEAAE